MNFYRKGAMKYLYKLITLAVLFFFANTNYTLFAQDYGFRIGTSWTSFLGQRETDAQGNPLESYQPALGFQLGFTSSYPFSDRMGLKIDMVYVRKSMTMNYAGEATKIFYTQDTKRKIVAKGQLNSSLKVTNTYFELPVTIYFRGEGNLELAAGVNFAFLASSKAKGEMTFEGNTEGGFPIPQFTAELDYNYKKDKDSTAILSARSTPVEGSGTVRLPQSVGAYYENRTSESPRFNSIDVGLVGEVKYRLNDNVSLSGRVTYSMKDITNNESDFSQCKIDNNKNLALTQDYDRFLTYQLSLIFRL
jgi:Outer membrane protein beta-barrel domain